MPIPRTTKNIWTLQLTIIIGQILGDHASFVGARCDANNDGPFSKTQQDASHVTHWRKCIG